MPLLSVLVPVYNVEKYIAACLLSVLENDLAPDQFEIIVVDDESPDNSIAIVKEMMRNKPNIRLVSQKNTGISGARNTGIRHAEGSFLLFLDSDDWLKKGCLRKLLDITVQNQLDVLEFGIEKITNDGIVTGCFSTSSSGKVYAGTEYYKSCRGVNSVFNKIYRTRFILENNLFFTEKIYVEDFEMNTRAFLAAERVSAIDDLVYQYRQSPDSITRTKDENKKRKMIEDHVFVLRKTQELSMKYTSEDDLAFLGERMSFLVVSVFYLMLKNNFSYSEMKDMRTRLKSEGLYQLGYTVHQKDKNVFRKVLLKNFSLLALLKSVPKKLIS